MFEADLGGTNILAPLEECVKLNVKNREKRIFLLTDGQVGNVDAIVAFALKNRDAARIHTFGIGSGADKHLVSRTAKAGRGSASFAADQSSDLSGQVIEALKRAFEPSL